MDKDSLKSWIGKPVTIYAPEMGERVVVGWIINAISVKDDIQIEMELNPGGANLIGGDKLRARLPNPSSR